MNDFKILECKVYQTKLIDGATHYEIDKDFLDYVNNNYNGEKIQIAFEKKQKNINFHNLFLRNTK